MTLSELSPKQKTVLKWAFMPSTRDKYKAIICDGAVRSGKTVCMLTAFILWAMRNFNGQNFGICGKTVASAERNIVRPAQEQADLQAYFSLTYRRADHVLMVHGLGRENRFYIFGGKDESSYALIQGITLAGVLFDEVALMPRSFVDQAIARTLSSHRPSSGSTATRRGRDTGFTKSGFASQKRTGRCISISGWRTTPY